LEENIFGLLGNQKERQEGLGVKATGNNIMEVLMNSMKKERFLGTNSLKEKL
jgi:hypothetical protein